MTMDFIMKDGLKLASDTIIVKEFGGKINKERRIKKLTNDSLMLTEGVRDDIYYSRQLEFTENLRFN